MILRLRMRLLAVLMALVLPQGHLALRRVSQRRGASQEVAKPDTIHIHNNNNNNNFYVEDNAHRALQSDTLLCHIFVVQTRMDGFPDIVDEQNYECFPWSGEGESTTSYAIDLPNDFVDNYQAELATGDSYVIIPNGTITGREVLIPPNGTVSMFARRALSALGIKKPAYRTRRLSYKAESRTVLILRVRAPDANMTSLRSTLVRSFFGSTQASLRSQYNACSHGKLIMQPAPDRKDVGLVNGILDVTIRIPVTDVNRSVIKNAVTSAATKLLDLSSLGDVYDHVVYCLPPGTAGDWLSYGFINYFETVYNNQWCNYVSAQMHEVGHNFGLMHSHENFNPYSDRTCSMGFSYPIVAWPSMCFNALKYYKFDWFQDATISIHPNMGGLVKLIAPADYNSREDDQFVIVQILNPGSGPISPEGLPGQDFYAMWNLPKGENINTLSHKNATTIVQEYATFSNLVAALDFKSNRRYTLPYTYPNGDKIYVKLCDYVKVPGTSPDYLTLSVARDGDFCDQSPPTDDCTDDDKYSFTFNNAQVTCAWLSIRPSYQNSACKGYSVASRCRETCNTC